MEESVAEAAGVGGRIVRAYNWNVVIPFLTHHYPGIFSGLGRVRHLLEHLLSSSLRQERWQEVLALIALGEKSAALKAMATLTKEREGAESNVEWDSSPENDVFELNHDQLRMYIEGITELMKLSPFADQKKTSRPKLFETFWEQDFEAVLREAQLHGIRVPA